MIEDLRDLVERFEGVEEAKSRELILGLLRHGTAPLSRDHFTPGHITCTAVVLHPAEDAVLVVHHARLQRWLLPGGHVEPEDGAPWQAAAREAQEETGVLLDGHAGHLVGMDVHGIPPKKGEPYHLHHDLKFRLQATHHHVVVSEETRAVEWCAIDEQAFDRYDLPPSIRRAIRRSLR